MRDENGNVELTLKKQEIVGLVNKEIEFNISSYPKCKDFLNTLGLQQWVEVEKVRYLTDYQELHICLDEVHRLGSFIEIEFLTEEENKNEFYEQKILEIASSFGIQKEQRIFDYYDSMIANLEEKNC